METTVHPDYSNIVGVFKEREPAEQALEALKQAGFKEEQLTVYHQDEVPTDAAELTSATRFLIHVRAEGREQEAVAILTKHGSNNADLPTGTKLAHGSLISSDDAVN
ncbi:MAG TPA: hypothetical protein VGT44_13755, partial [Ktedonobacteraceae bacterium]|nr:hypothetical protein [Ktedonobacteraceae bacterium]